VSAKVTFRKKQESVEQQARPLTVEETTAGHVVKNDVDKDKHSEPVEIAPAKPVKRKKIKEKWSFQM
jgi:hypothetical protein